jgi:hypothetical protein
VSALWFLPIVVVAIGMVAVAAVSRHASTAAAELQRGCAALGELGAEITALHGEASLLRRSAEDLGVRRTQRNTTDH